MFEEDARDALITYLGYSVKQPETPVVDETPAEIPAETAVEEKTPVIESTITAEDLFAAASLPVKQPEIVEESKTVETPATPVNTPVEVNVEWRDELKESVIVGDFASAVSTCFKYHQYADAFVIAAWGGAELMEQTTVRVYKCTNE